MFEYERQQQKRKEIGLITARAKIKNKFKAYGDVKEYTGKQAGVAITASGVAVPVILPLPVMAGLGAIVAKKVDKVRIEKTDEHDKRYRIPRIKIY